MSRLSATDQALIDEAIAEGRVTHCAPGQSGFPGYVWDEQKGLVSRDPGQTSWVAQKNRRKNKTTSPGVRKRRERVKELHAAGWTQTDTARELSSKPSTIAHDARALGISFGDRYRMTRNQHARRMEDIEALRAAFEVVKTETGLAKHLGWSRTRVVNVAEHAEIDLDHPRRSAKTHEPA